MPLLLRHHDHHRGFRAPLPPACAALSGTVIRDTGAVTRHGLSPTPSRADPRLEADPLALALLKSRRHTTKIRSEEHTSELQSLMRISYAVFCLKKKKQQTQKNNTLTKHNHKKIN